MRVFLKHGPEYLYKKKIRYFTGFPKCFKFVRFFSNIFENKKSAFEIVSENHLILKICQYEHFGEKIWNLKIWDVENFENRFFKIEKIIFSPNQKNLFFFFQNRKKLKIFFVFKIEKNQKIEEKKSDNFEIFKIFDDFQDFWWFSRIFEIFRNSRFLMMFKIFWDFVFLLF